MSEIERRRERLAALTVASEKIVEAYGEASEYGTPFASMVQRGPVISLGDALRVPEDSTR